MVVACTRPRLCFFGHHHARIDTEVAGVRCIGLNKIPCAGSLVAIDIESGAQICRVLDAWPGRES